MSKKKFKQRQSIFKTDAWKRFKKNKLALIGLAVVVAIGVVIAGIIWWVFRTNMDIEIESEKWEEE